MLLAGDFIAGHRPGTATDLAPGLVAPLKRLQPRLATVAVLGNHDHWTGADAVRDALRAAEITVLENDAHRFGALTLVAIGDAYTGHDRIAEAMAAARRLPGTRAILSHGPDIVPELLADAPLVLTGHTIAARSFSRGGARYRCHRTSAAVICAALSARVDAQRSSRLG